MGKQLLYVVVRNKEIFVDQPIVDKNVWQILGVQWKLVSFFPFAFLCSEGS